MDIDIRIPIGLLFAMLGVLLAGYGLASGPEIYDAHSLGVNINLAWGLALLVFGLGTLGVALGWKRKR
ncbi:MAG: hypothetical protein ABI655_00580 [Phenylobacterium sp.]